MSYSESGSNMAKSRCVDLGKKVREQSQLRTAKESRSLQLSLEVEEGLGDCLTMRPKFSYSNAFKGFLQP